MFYDPGQTQYFKEMLWTITQHAFTAGGYQLGDDPLGQARGLVKFYKPMPQWGTSAQVEVAWQLLAFRQSPVARFRIELVRVNAGQYTAQHTLTHVIWHMYGDRILPSDDFWWEFRTGDELPHALAAAGKLLFAYGIPWLENPTP